MKLLIIIQNYIKVVTLWILLISKHKYNVMPNNAHIKLDEQLKISCEGEISNLELQEALKTQKTINLLELTDSLMNSTKNYGTTSVTYF